jgi:hypothetical protein
MLTEQSQRFEETVQSLTCSLWLGLSAEEIFHLDCKEFRMMRIEFSIEAA